MEITLKNLKVAKFMSHETLCYSATIYVNGKKAGIAENQGYGGCASVSLDPAYHSLLSMKFNVPCGCDGEHDCILCSGTGTYGVGIYDYVDELANNMQNSKERTAFINKVKKQGFNVLVVFDGQYVALKANTQEEVDAILKKKYADRKIKETIHF